MAIRYDKKLNQEIQDCDKFVEILNKDLNAVGKSTVKNLIDSIPEIERAMFLSVRPGITGPATLKYRNEEEILASVEDSEKYNREVIFPDKVIINLEYITNYKFSKDIIYIFKTIFNFVKI